MRKVKDLFGQAARVIILSALAAGTFSMVLAWTGPSAGAPAGNVSGPINISGNTQTKVGTIIAGDICTSAGKCLSSMVNSFGGGYQTAGDALANYETGGQTCPTGTIARHSYTMDTNSTFSGGNGWLCEN